MDLKTMLNAQLRTRHATAASSSSSNSAELPILKAETEEESAAIVAQRHDAVSALTARPITHDEMRSALGAIRHTLNATPFGLSSYQVPTDDVLIQTVVEGYEKNAAKLEPLYASLEAELLQRGVTLDQLKVVTMVCAGGCPFREFGLGDSLERGVEQQLSIALEHGIVFDFVPVTFSDFRSHIVSLGVGVGAVLLAKLRARTSGRVRMDGAMFACKGTLAAALAARAFVSEGGAEEAVRLGLFGMGTDLTQGFEDVNDECAAACAAKLNVAVMNSLQDTNVGHGEATKTGLEARAARIGGTALWVDVEARLAEFGGAAANPEHGWYPAAFRRKCCSAVRAAILGELGEVVGASAPPCDVVEEVVSAPSQAPPPMSAAEKLRQRRHATAPQEGEEGGGGSGAPRRRSPLVLNALLANAGGVKLNHVETKVTLLKDFVGNEMFVAE